MTDERLSPYRRKRRAGRTPEPSVVEPSPHTAPPADTARRFVVQRHRARRLHYDVRFELDGVLVSFAVPKGPTLDPNARRMAVHVEDHPIEYLDFEGVIPAGEYGGGDVIVWDAGTWEPVGTDDPAAAIERGDFHADLHGQKLNGRIALVRNQRAKGDQWLLIHKRDEHAVVGWDPEAHPESVQSGRTNDEVARRPAARWRSDRPAASAREELIPTFAPASPDELAALERLGTKGTWTFAGRQLRLTNLDKQLFAGRDDEPPVTKRDLIRYAASMAPLIVAYLAGRPLNMRRHPDGAERPGFWHKQLPAHAPEWLGRWTNEEADPGETTEYLVVDEPAALVWAANFGALEWHAWTSRTESPHRPSYALIDIDPGERSGWEDVLTLAHLYRTALEHLGVESRAKLTGGRGLHIWVPVVEQYSFDQTRDWVEQVSRTIGAVVPELVSWKWEVRDRAGLARLDYTQNAINKTLVAPYSPRARTGAPVSAPIAWDELDDPSLRPDRWTIRTIGQRVAEKGDLFSEVLGHTQQLPSIE